jgi:hypothetical protein
MNTKTITIQVKVYVEDGGATTNEITDSFSSDIWSSDIDGVGIMDVAVSASADGYACDACGQDTENVSSLEGFCKPCAYKLRTLAKAGR